MNWKNFSILAVILFAVFILANRFYSSKRLRNLSPIRIAIPNLYSSSLIILAQERGIFKKNGLDVTLGLFDYGKECIDEMLKNNFDFSIAYITPIAKKIHAGEKFLILTELHNSSDNTLLIYRKNLPRKNAEEPVIRQVGLVKDTNAEFLLSLFAETKAIAYKKLKVVNVEKRSQLANDLLSGKLEAAILWQPTASELLSKHSDLLGRMDMPFYTDISLLIGNNSFIENYKTETDLLMKSIVEAKSYFDMSPEQANRIVLSYIKESFEVLNTDILSGINIDPRLSQIMVVMLESEIRWLSQRKFKFTKKLNKEEFIRKDYLQKYLPSKVTFQ
jgi:ABC-type nitrate/sulfonate/bicarbonate transport system substrate-binding protein